MKVWVLLKNSYIFGVYSDEDTAQRVAIELRRKWSITKIEEWRVIGV